DAISVRAVLSLRAKRAPDRFAVLVKSLGIAGQFGVTGECRSRRVHCAFAGTSGAVHPAPAGTVAEPRGGERVAVSLLQHPGHGTGELDDCVSVGTGGNAPRGIAGAGGGAPRMGVAAESLRGFGLGKLKLVESAIEAIL